MSQSIKFRRNKLMALKMLTDIIFKGILSEYFSILIFTLILISLGVSCYYESSADTIFDDFVQIQKEVINISLSKLYIRHYIFHMIFGWLHNFLFYSYSQYMKSLIYKFLLKKYLKLNVVDFSSIGTGKISSSIHKQADSTIFFLSNILLNFFYSIFYMGLFFIKIYRSNKLTFWLKMLFVIVFIAILLLIMLSCFISFKHKSVLLKAEHSNSHALLDILRNFTIVKAFNREKYELHKFEDQMKSQINLGFVFYKFETLTNLMFKMLLFSCLMTVILSKSFPLQLTSNNQIFFVFLGLFIRFRKHINVIRDSIFKINDKFVESVTCELNSIPTENSKVIVSGSTAKIDFADTSIHYDSNLVFSNLNISINQGDKIAITGRNGVGKSTIMKSLMGMQSYEGEILINGISISEINEASLREFISYVPQEPNLFDTTVMDNLKYGRDISDEEVFRKCEECGVHSMFKGLENGYMTIVGENCKNISGGQAQMINFMRAYIKDAPIFLLDEPTSALDYSTSKKLMDMVFDHLKHKIVMLTTHNPTHLNRFDKVINIFSNQAVVYQTPESFLNDNSFEYKM